MHRQPRTTARSSRRHPIALALAATAALLSSSARADEPPSDVVAPPAGDAAPAGAAPPRGAATDSALAAVLGGEVALKLRDGGESRGVLLSFSADAIQLAREGAAPIEVSRAEVVQLRLLVPSVVGDVALASALGAKVTLRLRDGSEADGRLLTFTPDALTLVNDDGVVLSVARAEVARLRHRVERRRFGLNLGFLPGLMLDVDAGLFRAYVSGSVVFPAALEGKLWGLSTGVGVGIPVLPSTPQFKMDVLAHANLMGVASACSACNYPTAHVFGFGLAVGMHTTFDSGFTMGLTVPVIGYSVTPNYHGTANAAVGYYFLSSAVSMPLTFIGYRF